MPGGNILALGVFVLVFACLATAIMVLRGDPDTRRLEGRVRSFVPSGGGSGPAVGPKIPARNIRRTETGTPLARFLQRIGRSPHVPAERRIPWPLIAAVGAAAAACGAYIGSKVVGEAIAPFIGAGVGLLAARTLYRMESSSYQMKLFKQLPDAMGMILRAIRAGLPMGEALANVARELESPTREEFAQVANNIAIGQATDAALFALAERSGLTEYYFFAVTVGLQAQTGGNLGETLENLADMVRKRVAMAGRTKALTAEARMSAIILSVLPVAVGALISLMKPGHLNPLFETDLGFKLLLIGGTMLGMGLLIIRTLLKGAVKD